eukprot:scaffold85801_cov33-Phaeocystis_antarctica.AAC.1
MADVYIREINHNESQTTCVPCAAARVRRLLHMSSTTSKVLLDTLSEVSNTHKRTAYRRPPCYPYTSMQASDDYTSSLAPHGVAEDTPRGKAAARP